MQNAICENGSAHKKQRKVMTSGEKVEMINIYHRLMYAVAYHFNIIYLKDHCKKDKRKFVKSLLWLHQQS